MPRVLLLARHFPPIGGAGVHRTIGSVRHLRDHGYEPVVVTGPAAHHDRWTPRDESLLERVPADLEVHRVAADTMHAETTRIDRLRNLPAPWITQWITSSTRLGVLAGGDVVYASCLPYETAVAGAQVARQLGRPWIADLEDPWALDEMRAYATGLHRRHDRRRMRDALSSAAAVIMAAPEAAERVRHAFPELASRIVCAIEIGFEADDFRPQAAPGHTRADGPFRIVHTGSMHTDFGLRLRATSRRRRLLGGTFPGIDVLPRSHVFLVDAIAGLLEAEPALRGRVELHLAGELTAGDRAVADRHSFVSTAGLLTHRETVALMQSADALFLPMHDLPAGVRAGLIPYKTYEYLAAGRPILAAVPDGDVRDMLGPLKHVTIVRPTDVRGMTAALRTMLAGAREDAGDTLGASAVAHLERRVSVARIAQVLDAVIASPRGTSRTIGR